MNPRILVVGAGITGAATYSLLRRKLPNVTVIVWDKARKPGGRMTTARISESNGHVDLGAQYITTTQDAMEEMKEFYEPLLQNNVLVDLDETVIENMKNFSYPVKHFVAPEGICSIVEHFLHGIPPDCIKFGHHIVSVAEIDGQYVVETEEDKCSVDAVVLTFPVPQVLQLKGSLANKLQQANQLKEIRYSSRYALVLMYNMGFPQQSWACRYLDHEVFRFVSIDNKKRRRSHEPTSIVLHTSITFGEEHLETPLPEIQQDLLMRVENLFPSWPKPTAVRCHRWRYSQVVTPYPNRPGCLVLTNKPTAIVGGDAFAESNLDGCLFSAVKITEALSHIWAQ